MEVSVSMFMLGSWGLIISLLAFCFYKLLNNNREQTLIRDGNKKET